MSQSVAFSIQPDVSLRFLSPTDIPRLKVLCADWFPIDYPDSWYEDITSSPRFYSLAAVYSGHIVGIIVCEVKNRVHCNREDMDMLASSLPASTQVAYILSLGVDRTLRRYGIASMLLEYLINHLGKPEFQTCKALYLHVLTSNVAAIKFYERHKFSLHSFLPYYYSIKGKPHDGYSYVSYLNGGQPPYSVIDHVWSWTKKQLGNPHVCALPVRLLQSAKTFWRGIFPIYANTNLQQIRHS